MIQAQAHPEIIDAEACADLLLCTVKQVEEMARNGEIPGTKLGRGWIFVRADLIAYIAERARSEAADRRLRQAPKEVVVMPRSRRQAPPALPVPAR